MHTTNLRKVGGSVMLAVPPALLEMLHLRAGATVAAVSNAWNLDLDMVDDLDLVVQRIDLNGRASSRLSAQGLKDLVGRHRGHSDRNVEGLRVCRRRRVERVADAGREPGDPLIQWPAPLERYEALQIRGHNRRHLPRNHWRQPAELGHLGVDMLHALPQRLFRVGHAGGGHRRRHRVDARTSGGKQCGDEGRSDRKAQRDQPPAVLAGARGRAGTATQSGGRRQS